MIDIRHGCPSRAGSSCVFSHSYRYPMSKDSCGISRVEGASDAKPCKEVGRLCYSFLLFYVLRQRAGLTYLKVNGAMY